MSFKSSKITNTITFHVPHSVEQLVHQLHISHGIFQIHLHISFAINCIICIWVFCSLYLTLPLYTHQVFKQNICFCFCFSVSVPRVVFPHLLAATDCNTLPAAVLLFSICFFFFVFLLLFLLLPKTYDSRCCGLYMANYTAQQNVRDRLHRSH